MHFLRGRYSALWSSLNSVQGGTCNQLGKNPLKYSAMPWPVVEPGPHEGRTVRWISSPTELSWPRPQGGQTVRYIQSPLSYHDPGHWEDRQWNTFSLPLSNHDPGHREDRQWDTFSLPLSYHDPGHREDRQWNTFSLPLSYHDPGHREGRQWNTFSLPLSYHHHFTVLYFNPVTAGVVWRDIDLLLGPCYDNTRPQQVDEASSHFSLMSLQCYLWIPWTTHKHRDFIIWINRWLRLSKTSRSESGVYFIAYRGRVQQRPVDSRVTGPQHMMHVSAATTFVKDG